MKSKNIVFVLNEYNGLGGAQRVASILAEEFTTDNHNVSVLSINEQKGEPSYFSDDINVKVIHPNGYRAPLPIELSSNLKAGRYKKVLKEIKRRYLLEKKRKEVLDFIEGFGDEEVYVIVIQVYAMQWLEPLLFKENVKIIGQSHESVAASKGTHRYKRILKYYRQVSKFLLLSEKDAQYFTDIGFTNTGVMYNPTTFRDNSDPEELFENKRIISTGRLIEDKGFDVLIESFARIATEIPGWELSIYGDGPARKSLQILIDVLDMNDRIKLKGQTDNVESALKKASFFVLSSKAEGLPMSLIEAQSCCLPCISTDCAPGIREIIAEYKTGLIAPVDDIPVLARHIKKIAQNKDDFINLSKNAYNNSSKFDKSVIKEQWYELFEQLGGY